MNEKLSHIVGTFIIDAMPSFLNGAGIAQYKENKNLTLLKTFADGTGESPVADSEAGVEQGGPRKIKNYRTVYVSAQSFRRMLRDTLIEETSWRPSLMRPYAQNKEGHTSKAGTGLDPVAHGDDDIFGYFFTVEGSGKPVVSVDTATVLETDGGNDETATAAVNQPTARVRSISRTSPLSTSILVGLRKDGWLGIDEAYVHLREGTPLPYDTQFANTPFQGIFSLDYSRLCRYSNVGDRIELGDELLERYLDSKEIVELEDQKQEYYSLETTSRDFTITKGIKKGKIERRKVFTPKKQYGNVYELTNASRTRKERASALINSLAVLRGGAKQAAFGTDVTPKVLIMAGLTCGNPIFNTLFEDDNSHNIRGKTISIDINALKEIVKDFKDKICTDVYVGIRTGFLKKEDEVRRMLKKEDGFIVTTPRDAARQLTESLLVGQS